MNSVFFIGRLTKDPELRVLAETGKSIAKFGLAVDREFSKEKKTDFFNVVVWGKQAESIAEYIGKGSQVGIRGSVQNNNYEKDGKTVYATLIVAERVEFLSYKNEKNAKVEKKDDYLKGFESVDDKVVPF